MDNEYELISCQKLQHVKLFLNDITYRNYHIHSAFEVLLVLDGSGHINLQDRNISVQRGSIILINPYELHEIDAQGGHIVTVVIQISRHFCETYIPHLSNLRFFENNLSECLEMEIISEISRRILRLAQVYLHSSDYFALDCLSLSLDLLKLLIYSVPQEIPSDHDCAVIRKHVRQTTRILNFLDSNYTTTIRLQDVAELSGLSSTYVSHLFTQNIGISMQEYLNNLRFEHAMNLARTTALSATAIALRSGFSDLKYLNKMTRKRFGCNMKDYLQETSVRAEMQFNSVMCDVIEHIYPEEEAVRYILKHLQ